VEGDGGRCRWHGRPSTDGDEAERDGEVRVVDVEIWSDVVCPWCYVGKRQFEAALDKFAHADQVSVTWRSFELDPTSPPEVGLSMDVILQRKYGMSGDQARKANERMTALAAELGLEYHLDRVRAGNTFDAHRLIHLAATHGRGDAVKERLLAAYFTEGRSIGDRATLTAVAEESGLDRAEVEATFDGQAFADEVRADESRAAALGATGVPFFVIDEAYGVAGAQGTDVLLAALEQAWSASHPITVVEAPERGPDGGACADGVCAV
jgi:predicted DsbA family dithiol-disulfide isomerase